MTQEASDLYLSSLKAREEEISRKESALKREEDAHAAKGEQLRIARAAFEEEKRAQAAAFTSYIQFLNSAGKSAPHGTSTSDEDSFSNLRIGDQRKAVLRYIALRSRNKLGSQVRTIAAATNLNNGRVSNIVWKDTERGLLMRTSDQIFMTERGFEFARLAGILDDEAA